MYSFLAGLCQTQLDLVQQYTDKMSPFILHNLEEKDPAICGYLWEAVLSLVNFAPVRNTVVSGKPHSSLGSIADLRTAGRWFDPRLGQYSSRGLIIVIATGFIPHCCLLLRQWLSGKAASSLERILCRLLVKKNSRKAWVGALAAAI